MTALLDTRTVSDLYDRDALDLVTITPEGAEALASVDLSDLPLDVWPLEAVCNERDELREQIKALQAAKTRIDAELTRRINANNPDFDQLSPGSASVVGEVVEVKLTWKRDYSWDAEALGETRQHLTQAEYDQLVKVEVKGNGTAYNKLIGRGGPLAEILQRARTFKNATPAFEFKARQ